MRGVVSVDAVSDRRFGRHFHDQFGVGVMLAGAQISASGRGEVQAQKGDVITVNPGEVHDGRPIGQSARHWCMLYFDLEFIARTARAMGISAGAELQHPVLRRPEIARAFQSLHENLLLQPESTLDDLAAEDAMLTIFAPLFAVCDAPGPLFPSTIALAKAAIDDDPASARTLAEMSRIAGLGRYQFLRAFKAATGLPPHAYKVQKQLQMARRLIVNGTPIADAAIASGFADQAHMSRHFARAYGLRPGAFAAGMKC